MKRVILLIVILTLIVGNGSPAVAFFDDNFDIDNIKDDLDLEIVNITYSRYMHIGPDRKINYKLELKKENIKELEILNQSEDEVKIKLVVEDDENEMIVTANLRLTYKDGTLQKVEDFGEVKYNPINKISKSNINERIYEGRILLKRRFIMKKDTIKDLEVIEERLVSERIKEFIVEASVEDDNEKGTGTILLGYMWRMSRRGWGWELVKVDDDNFNLEYK